VNPLDLLRDPNLVQSMTLNQKLISGLQVAILGMLIVFLILFLLMIVVNILKKIFYSEKIDFKEDAKKVEPKVADLEPDIDHKKEVAAIMAAIMSIESSSKQKKFKIKKITRVKDDVPIWGRVTRGGISANHKGELL